LGVKGAAVEDGPMILFSSSGTPPNSAEVSTPDLKCNYLLITGLRPEKVYEANLGGLNVSTLPAAVLPGVSAGTVRVRANQKGVLQIERNDLQNLRLRIKEI
jgi:hypothetical protein